MRPSCMYAIGGASGDTPTRRIGGSVGSLTCGPGTVHPSTASKPTSPAALIAPPIATSPLPERDLDAFGRRLRLDALARRVQRHADAVLVLQGRDALAATER